jgi:putative sigma-54 modulation protein
MEVEITGRHVLVTSAIQTYVLKRLKRFERILAREGSFHVILGVQKGRQTAEIVLKSKYLSLTGKGETGDLYSSILRAVEKIERQAIKHKGKVIETKRHKAKVASVAKRLGIRGGSAAGRPRPGNGIYEEEAPKKPMHLDEALLELGHAENPFVVFRDVESGQVRVVYRRKDGSLGLVSA